MHGTENILVLLWLSKLMYGKSPEPARGDQGVSLITKKFSSDELTSLSHRYLESDILKAGFRVKYPSRSMV
jgi:hypothetical protein